MLRISLFFAFFIALNSASASQIIATDGIQGTLAGPARAFQEACAAPALGPRHCRVETYLILSPSSHESSKDLLETILRKTASAHVENISVVQLSKDETSIIEAFREMLEAIQFWEYGDYHQTELIWGLYEDALNNILRRNSIFVFSGQIHGEMGAKDIHLSLFDKNTNEFVIFHGGPRSSAH
jgi:hypothetical protein